MSKKRKTAVIILTVLILLALAALGTVLYIKKNAPPGEEWISYHNDEVIDMIDRQLEGLDAEKIVQEKEAYVIEKNIQEIQEAVKDEKLSYEELTAIYLYRIKTLDQCEKGYNSVIAVNPDAIAEARRKDEYRRQNPETASELYGIPVMLKDNINTADLPTSAGAAAFSDFYPSEDAGLVKALKDNGAIILGKNNLSEFAYYVSNIMPAGYSGSKGQTTNPFGPLKISPSGSSSGSAVAVTANLAPISIGTETDGSIAAPSAMNSVVGFKPSRGSLPGDGIFPLIKKLDAAGPIAKCVSDAAVAYNSMSGAGLSLNFDRDALNGRTIGLLSYEYNDRQMLSELKDQLQEAGAKVVEVDIDTAGISVFNNISLTFKEDFETYTQAFGFPVTSLESLLEYNREDPVRRIRYGQNLLEEAARIETADWSEIDKSIQKADEVLQNAFDEYRLDALVFLNSSGTTAPAAAGYPELTVPLGSDKKDTPQGATFAVRFGEDEKLLNLGYSFEYHTRGRLIP